MDFSPEMLRVAKSKAEKKRTKATFKEGDAESLPFENESFDVVVNRHLLWTLPHPQQALSEWLRVLVPGGTLIIIDGSWNEKGNLTERLIRLFRKLSGKKKKASLKVYDEMNISDQLPMQSYKRPEADLRILHRLNVKAQADPLDVPIDSSVKGTRFVVTAWKPVSKIQA